jgi:hypothetical protein
VADTAHLADTARIECDEWPVKYLKVNFKNLKTVPES